MVFCHVTSAREHCDVELSCEAMDGPRKDWMTGEAMFGHLQDGTIIKSTSFLLQRLLDPSNLMLKTLGRELPFEMVVGVNGLVWIHSPSTPSTILISNAILCGESLSNQEGEVLVERLLQNYSKTKEKKNDKEDEQTS